MDSFCHYLNSFKKLFLLIISIFLFATTQAYAQASWTIVQSPNSDPSSNEIRGLGVIAANDIWAVGGSSNDSTGLYQTLLQHYNGSNWVNISDPVEPTGEVLLNDVAGRSSNDVWAIGRLGDALLIEHWDGTNWSVAPNPSTPGTATRELKSISAVSSNDIWAAGHYWDYSGEFPVTKSLVLHYDGAQWAYIPEATSDQYENLNAVSARASNDVWVAGTASDDLSEDFYPLIKHYNGTDWLTVPFSTLPVNSKINDILALSTTNVWAVGSKLDDSGFVEQSLILHYNGTNWTVADSSTSVTEINYLSSISSTTLTDIWAVGYTEDLSDTNSLILHYDGSSWERVSGPSILAGTSGHVLNAVVAISSNDVWAAGSFSDNEGSKTLIQRYLSQNNHGILTVDRVALNQAVDAVTITGDTPQVHIDVNNNGKADLVANRKTVVRVEVETEGLENDQEVEFQLKVGNQTYPVEKATVESLQDGPVDLFFTPSTSEETAIQLTIDPEDKLDVETIVQPDPINVEVKGVRDLTYTAFPVAYLGNPSLFDSTVSNSKNYLEAVYPVSNITINKALPFIGTPFSLIPEKGAYNDAQALFVIMNLLSPKPERVIAIAPSNWFTYHNLKRGQVTATGVTYKDIPVAFVSDGYALATAHEIGHTYGFGEGYTLKADGTCCSYEGDPTEGYWVQMGEDVSSALDYMGTSPAQTNYPESGFLRWSTVNRFETLFSNFRSNPIDPPVLIITGLVRKDGTSVINNMYRKADGVLSEPSTGDGKIVVKDGNGAVLSETSFAIDYTVSDTDVILEEAPFAKVVPYPETAASVEIVKDDTVLTKSFTTTELLRVAINSIPDEGFVKDPEVRRGQLLMQVDEIDKKLASKETNDVLNKLRNLRRDVERELKDSYEVTSPLQYTKPALLQLIDELIQSNEKDAITFAKLKSDLKGFYEQEKIKNKIVYNTLKLQADIAEKASLSNQPLGNKLAILALKTFQFELNKVRGKSVTEDAYQVLFQDAKALIDSL